MAVDPELTMAVAEEHMDDARRPIGSIFVEKGLVTQEQLDEALLKQAQTNERLGEVLVELGFIDRMDLASALSRQWTNGDLPIKTAVAPSNVAAPLSNVAAPEVNDDDELTRLRADCEDLRKQVTALRQELARGDDPVDVTSGRHFLLVPNAGGYSLVARDGDIPHLGQAIPIRLGDGDVKNFAVTKVAQLPLPEPTPCAYLEAATPS